MLEVRNAGAQILEHSTKITNGALTHSLDAVQRIYPRGFDWEEAGVTVTGANSRRLSRNFRNTAQIAAFAHPLVRDLPLEDDGTLPEFHDIERDDGPGAGADRRSDAAKPR